MLDINTLAAWGEFIGGIAVVVSLIYLASQIRQNSKLLRASTASASISTINDQATLVAQDPELTRIYWDGLADRSSLSEADRRRFDPVINMTLTGFSQEYQFAADGIIGPAVWNTRVRGYRWFFRNPGLRHWWSEWRDLFDDDFGRFIDGLIREGEAAE